MDKAVAYLISCFGFMKICRQLSTYNKKRIRKDEKRRKIEKEENEECIHSFATDSLITPKKDNNGKTATYSNPALVLEVKSSQGGSYDTEIVPASALNLSHGQTEYDNNETSNSSTCNVLHITSARDLASRSVDPVVERIDSKEHHVLVIGVAGGSGSGKTTLSRAIYNSIGEKNITFISHDSYYKDNSHLTLKQREKLNFDHPDALDTDLLVENIKSLQRNEVVRIPTYDYATHSRLLDTTELPSRPIILIEGILIYTHPKLLELMDVKIFVDTDDDIRLIRRLQRDINERGRTFSGVVQQYISTVRPMHKMFVEPSKRNADIIVPVGLNSVALDLVVNKLKAYIDPNIPTPYKIMQADTVFDSIA